MADETVVKVISGPKHSHDVDCCLQCYAKEETHPKSNEDSTCYFRGCTITALHRSTIKEIIKRSGKRG